MPAILLALGEILASLAAAAGTLSSILGIVQRIEVALGLVVEGPTNQQIYDLLSTVQSEVATIQSESGTSAQTQQLQNDALNAILSAVNPSGASTPPPPPPPPPSSSDNASAVWEYRDPNTDQPTVDLLADAALLAINMTEAQVGLPCIGNPPWIGAGGWTSTSGPARPDTNLPLADTSTVLATDPSIAAWLNRAYPGYAVLDLGDGWAYVADRGGALNWVYGLSPWEFERIKAALGPSGSLVVPPVWPGLANVTLGAAVALADGLTVSGPLSGVIVTISAVPPATPYYAFGSRLSYKWLGAVTFLDDNGQAEEAQPLGFDHLLITPRKMAQAASAVVRLKSGTVGTIQPFTNH